jgi:hypothetical protein
MVARRLAIMALAGWLIVFAASWSPAQASSGHRHVSRHGAVSPARIPFCDGPGPIIPGPRCVVPQF